MTKRTTIATFTIALLCAVTISGCTIAIASEGAVDKPDYRFQWITDKYFEHREPQGAVRIMQEQAEKAAVKSQEAAQAAVVDEVEVFTDYEYIEPYTPSQPSEVRGNPNGLNSFDGVYDYNGKTESFYASHAVYDDQLTVDDDGFFRDDQGRYVVATDDYEQGTEIEISQGKAIVMDGGTEPGVIDVHTIWGR